MLPSANENIAARFIALSFMYQKVGNKITPKWSKANIPNELETKKRRNKDWGKFFHSENELCQYLNN